MSIAVVPPRPRSVRRRLVPLLALAYTALALGLFAYPTATPLLIVDDFQILFRSWTWNATWNNLWVPANEHAMPLGRLTTYVLIHLAGRPTIIPYVTALQGPLALVLGMVLTYHLVRREQGHPLYGLVAMALFGVTTVFQQAVTWYSASFSVVALDTLIVALLAAQAFARTGKLWQLAACVVACTLAPAWFAIGILAGPVCGLYLYLETAGRPPSDGRSSSFRLNVKDPRPYLRALAPLLGSALFLAVSLPRTKDAILHLEHYQGKTTLEVLNLRMGALNSCRSTVENLLLGVTGVGGVTVPLVIVFPALALAAATAVWAVWGSRRPALPLTGLALIGASYLLTYSARAEWTYEGVMNQPNWSRYHLLPQLGLSFLVAGALSRRAERWRMDAAGRLTRRQVLGLSVLGLLLFVTQLPRGLVACCWLHRADGHLVITWQRWHDSQAQHEALRRIEAVDAVCRQQRIDAKLVPLAVGTLHDAMPLDCPTEDNWQFLRGSDDPDPAVTVEQVQRWLESAGYGNGAEPQ